MSRDWDQGLWFDAPPDGPTWRMPQVAQGAIDHKPISWWRSATQEALGIDSTRPVMMTGHQPTVHHPGILSKYMALSQLVRINEATGLELIIDHHVGVAGIVPVPKLVKTEDGLLRHQLHLLSLDASLPLCWQAPQQPQPLDKASSFATEDVAEGLGLMHGLLCQYVSATDAAGQLAETTAQLRSPWVADFSSVRASKLLETPFGRRLVELMYDDPRSCVEAYNKAVHTWPEAQMRKLKIESDQIELPLWTQNNDGQRVSAKVGPKHPSAPQFGSLLPRALLITAISRIGIADLFIHGRSGAAYDKVMEQWISDWLGLQPAGAVAISCTQTLPGLESLQINNRQRLDHLISLSHQLWHDPQQLDSQDNGPSLQKKRYLDMLEQTEWKTTQRRQKFIEMHQFLSEQRQEYGSRLQSAKALSRDAHAAILETNLPSARDWPFIFYPDKELSSLNESIQAYLGVEGLLTSGKRRSSLR